MEGRLRNKVEETIEKRVRSVFFWGGRVGSWYFFPRKSGRLSWEDQVERSINIQQLKPT